MLNVERLEGRDCPAVTVCYIVSVGMGTTPTVVVMDIQGDPQHSPGHTVVLPTTAGAPFDRIDMRA